MYLIKVMPSQNVHAPLYESYQITVIQVCKTEILCTKTLESNTVVKVVIMKLITAENAKSNMKTIQPNEF